MREDVCLEIVAMDELELENLQEMSYAARH